MAKLPGMYGEGLGTGLPNDADYSEIELRMLSLIHEQEKSDMAKKCIPSKYNVVTSSGAVTYGFRCAGCGVATKRYADEELRDQRLKEHKKAAKKN